MVPRALQGRGHATPQTRSRPWAMCSSCGEEVELPEPKRHGCEEDWTRTREMRETSAKRSFAPRGHTFLHLEMAGGCKSHALQVPSGTSSEPLDPFAGSSGFEPMLRSCRKRIEGSCDLQEWLCVWFDPRRSWTLICRVGPSYGGVWTLKTLWFWTQGLFGASGELPSNRLYVRSFISNEGSLFHSFGRIGEYEATHEKLKAC